jgi:hypothetical protein
MRVAIIAAIGLFACGCGSEEGPTGPTHSTGEHLVIVRVLNAESGAPLTNLSVAVLDGPQAGTTATSPSDQVPLQLRAGAMTLRITAQGFHPVDRTVRVDAPVVVEVHADRIPPPPPSIYKYFGFVRDGIGKPVQGVSITGYSNGTWYRSNTDTNGRYEMNVPAAGLTNFRIADVPPTHEGEASYGRDAPPGQLDFVAKRILRVILQPPPWVPRSGGTTRKTVLVNAEFDTGETRALGGRDPVTLSSSNPTILKTGGADGGTVYVEGLADGQASVVAHFWGVTSSPVTVRVGSSGPHE